MVVGLITGIECLPGGVPPPDPLPPPLTHQRQQPPPPVISGSLFVPHVLTAPREIAVSRKRVPRRFPLSRLRARCPAHSPDTTGSEDSSPIGGDVPPKEDQHPITGRAPSRPLRGATDDLSILGATAALSLLLFMKSFSRWPRRAGRSPENPLVECPQERGTHRQAVALGRGVTPGGGVTKPELRPCLQGCNDGVGGYAKFYYTLNHTPSRRRETVR